MACWKMILTYKNIYPLVNILKAIENGPVEIVDFPIKNGDFPMSYVKLPEGVYIYIYTHICSHGVFHGFSSGATKGFSLVGGPKGCH